MNAKIIKTKISEGLEQTMTKAYICLILNLNTKHKKNTHTQNVHNVGSNGNIKCIPIKYGNMNMKATK